MSEEMAWQNSSHQSADPVQNGDGDVQQDCVLSKKPMFWLVLM